MKLTVEALQNFYDELAKDADSDGVVHTYATKVWQNECGYPLQDYSRARQLLLKMEAIYVETQGAAGVPSVWHLLTRPTQDSWDSNLKRADLKEHFDSRLDSVIEMLQGVDITAELVAIAERFHRIEQRLNSAGIPDPYADDNKERITNG